MLKIFGRVTSINVRKVLWACGELGIAYEREDWGSGFADPRSPQFLALNPNGLVPAIRDGEFVLWESNAIIRYLGEKHGGLIPDDIAQRAIMSQWLSWQASELNPAWSYAVAGLIRRLPGFDDKDRRAASIAAWTAKMGVLEARLAETGAHVGGEDLTLADIALGLSVHRWLHCPFEDKPALPAVAAYHARVSARPAARDLLVAAMP